MSGSRPGGEPWTGSAAVEFVDQAQVGARIDRPGLVQRLLHALVGACPRLPATLALILRAPGIPAAVRRRAPARARGRIPVRRALLVREPERLLQQGCVIALQVVLFPLQPGHLPLGLRLRPLAAAGMLETQLGCEPLLPAPMAPLQALRAGRGRVPHGRRRQLVLACQQALHPLEPATKTYLVVGALEDLFSGNPRHSFQLLRRVPRAAGAGSDSPQAAIREARIGTPDSCG